MSTESFHLVALDCPSCGSSVAASSEDVVFYCISCRNGYRYRGQTPHLEPVEVAFVAASHVAAERYLPFWVLSARVEIHGRERGRPGRSVSINALLDGDWHRAIPGLMKGFFGDPPSRDLRGDGEFVVPAFRAPLDSTVELTRRYTDAYPKLDEKLGERLTEGCFGVEDAKKLAHFALIASEVDKPDLLRDLQYSMHFGEARLLGVPFARKDQRGTVETWADSLYGVPI